MTEQKIIAEELLDFIHNSPSTFHVVQNCSIELQKNGFQELDLGQSWELKTGGKYFCTKNNSALFAFTIGHSPLEETGLKLIAAHSDSPGFKIKPQPEMVCEGTFLKLNTETYGSPILMTWLDRPLSIAGRVILKSDNPLQPKQILVDLRKPLLIIPSLAIHMNRTVNAGVELNKQIDMLPLFALVNNELEKDNYLLKRLATELSVTEDQIIDFDLFLYACERGCLVGANEEFISSPKLDDLAMVHAGIKALVEEPNQLSTNFMCVFDNEEVGSLTKQGAGSPVLRNIIERLAEKLGKTNEQLQQAIHKSFMISADMAHCVHPNKPEKSDPVNRPVINGGPIVKTHANQKYTTDAESSAIFETICRLVDVATQRFVNRSDMDGGSTLGNVSTGKIDIRTVDIGNPMLSMHSIRELSGTADHTSIIKVFKCFYSL